PLRLLLQVRGSLPRCHPDRQPHHRAAQSQDRRAHSNDGTAFAGIAHGRGGPWPGRSRRAGASGSGAADARESAADCQVVGARQDRSDQDIPEGQDGGVRRGASAAWQRGREQMKFAYYPGCSARSTCAELNEATHLVASKLGLELQQLESATCTGAREIRAIDPAGFYRLNVRILALAEREALPLMTICNTCTLNLLDAHAA